MREHVDDGEAVSDSSVHPLTNEGSTMAVRRNGVVAAVVVGAMALVPRLLTVGHFYNLDEWLWMWRSQRFSEALMHGDLAHMSATRPIAGTMPGIPTVWLGTAAKWIWNAGGALGIVDPGQTFAESASAYTIAQVMVGLTTAVLIGLVVWLVAHWLSVRVAVCTGVIFATEPFWVGLGSMLHTDELVALFGMTGLIALAWTLELPAGVVGPRHRRRWAVVSAVALILSALTKVSGLLFVPAALAMMGWAISVAVRAADPGTRAATKWMGHLRMSGWMVLGALITVAVTYPALVVDPVTQWHALQGQLHAVSVDRRIYFMGRYRTHPGIAFYPVTLAYQSSAWFILLAPIGVAVALIRRATRRFALMILAWAIVPGIGLLTSSLRYPRYGLVVLGPLALAAACALHSSIPEPKWWAARANRVLAAGAAAMLLAAVWVAPWGAVNFNPIMGAYRKPILVMSVGWGEPIAVAMSIIGADARSHGRRCASVSVSGLGYTPIPGNCVAQRAATTDDADYVIVPAISIQRHTYPAHKLRRHFDLVSMGTVADRPLVEVWRRKTVDAE